MSTGFLELDNYLKIYFSIPSNMDNMIALAV
jgi:hypothetical protein